MTPRIELLWFDGCPNHEAARAMLNDVIGDLVPGTPIVDIDASDAVADEVRFPGSPTIRVDGHDIQPGFADPGDYTPRCRLYRTERGLRGVPERHWIEEALRIQAVAIDAPASTIIAVTRGLSSSRPIAATPARPMTVPSAPAPMIAVSSNPVGRGPSSLHLNR